MALFSVNLIVVVLSAAFVITSNGSVQDDVTFYLFTESLNDTELYEDNLFIVDISLPTVVIIHGWETSSNNTWVVGLTRTYLLTGDYNIITVDWSPVANQLYPISVLGVREVGEYIGDFIVDLNANYSINLSKVHLVGHSLGAHIAGFAGKRVQNRTSVNLGRITGLDPALPLYRFAGTNDRLASTDADLVVALHTDAGFNGYPDRIGNIDFYANGGTPSQPGCLELLDTSCSHMRAPLFFNESVYNPSGFVSTQCESYFNYLLGFCSWNKKITFGGNLTLDDAGQYYFTTNSEKPFSKE